MPADIVSERDKFAVVDTTLLEAVNHSWFSKAGLITEIALIVWFVVGRTKKVFEGT